MNDLKHDDHSNTDLSRYGGHFVDQADIDAVVEVLRSDWLTGGPQLERLEESLRSQTNATFASAMSSGTAALHAAAFAVGLDRGDTAIVPTVTFVATANVVRELGANVVFADVDPDTGLMRPEDLEEALARTPPGSAKCVLPVHLGGQTCDMEGIGRIARRNGLSVIEDACHALGTEYIGNQGKNRPVGDCSQCSITVFSAHPVKTIAMGEAGIATTNDAELLRRMNLWRSHGIVRDPASFLHQSRGRDRQGDQNPWYYEMLELGLNYRIDEMSCALGLSQMKKLPRFVEKRRLLASCYENEIAKIGGIVSPIPRVAHCNPAWHLFRVLIDFDGLGISRASLMAALKARQIGTQVHYIPVHTQPYYENLGRLDLPNAEKHYQRTLTLPLFFEMEEKDVVRVVRNLADCLTG